MGKFFLLPFSTLPPPFVFFFFGGVTIPTPGTNNFASAFNKDERPKEEEEEETFRFLVSVLFQNFSISREKITNSCEFKERDDDDKKPIRNWKRSGKARSGSFTALMTNDANDESYSQQFVAIRIRLGKEEGINSPPSERLNFSES